MDINSQNPGGDTALHFAAEKGRAETVKLLLERGVGTETTNVDDYTPLHLTAWTAQQGAARALLDAGANLEAPDVEGWTPPPYKVDTSRPSLRTNWTRLVPFPHRWGAARRAFGAVEAYHGSALENFHCILRCGLRSFRSPSAPRAPVAWRV